ncbi:MAG: NUDIX domain-containing protein [Actinomycetota bacterium]|nr:NUDIX domain-containing protein [Actinomycetota bacterium]MED5292406.1 NUDIX domain-containing protein [Actinomycetota bacterium]
MTFQRPPLCCVGAVFIWERKLLLIQRAKPPAKGLWSLPGGHVEPGESWQDAVEREVREETALEATCGPFIGWVERESEGHRYLIADFEIGVADPGTAKPGDDASNLMFAEPNELERLNISPGLRDFLDQHELMDF